MSQPRQEDMLTAAGAIPRDEYDRYILVRRRSLNFELQGRFPPQPALRLLRRKRWLRRATLEVPSHVLLDTAVVQLPGQEGQVVRPTRAKLNG